LKNHFFLIKQEEASIKNTLQYASTLFDLKEFRKCSFVLKPYAKPNYQTAMFLYYLSEYNLIEQKKQEEMLDTTEIGAKSFNSRDYVRLQQSLEVYYQKDELDAFNLYLYAIVLKELQLMDACRIALIKSLNLFPYLWSAWVELSLISKQSDMVKLEKLK
jgi:anaphase-promoting complex subunit 8